MQRIETTFAPICFESDSFKRNLFNSSQILMSNGSINQIDGFNLYKQLEFYWLCNENLQFEQNVNIDHLNLWFGYQYNKKLNSQKHLKEAKSKIFKYNFKLIFI